MQSQIYRILSERSGRPLRQIIRDTKRTDFYLDAQSAVDYGLVDGIVAGVLPEPKAVVPLDVDANDAVNDDAAPTRLNLVEPAAKEHQ
jgi:hypothetical protein